MPAGEAGPLDGRRIGARAGDRIDAALEADQAAHEHHAVVDLERTGPVPARNVDDLAGLRIDRAVEVPPHHAQEVALAQRAIAVGRIESHSADHLPDAILLHQRIVVEFFILARVFLEQEGVAERDFFVGGRQAAVGVIEVDGRKVVGAGQVIDRRGRVIAAPGKGDAEDRDEGRAGEKDRRLFIECPPDRGAVFLTGACIAGARPAWLSG